MHVSHGILWEVDTRQRKAVDFWSKQRVFKKKKKAPSDVKLPTNQVARKTNKEDEGEKSLLLVRKYEEN